jgi:hypothetical protein
MMNNFLRKELKKMLFPRHTRSNGIRHTGYAGIQNQNRISTFVGMMTGGPGHEVIAISPAGLAGFIYWTSW